VSVASSNLLVGPLAQGPGGYFTPPIAAGKTAAFTLKITPQKTEVPNDEWIYGVVLRDTAGASLDSVAATVETSSATGGGTSHDMIVNAAGQLPVSAFGLEVSSPNLKLGGSSSFTVKLKNGGPVASTIPFRAVRSDTCDASYAVTVKAGSTDITDQAEQGYITPTLAPGASKTLTVTIKYLSVTPCEAVVVAFAGTPSDGVAIYLLANGAAT
jgi:hypothetical protein